MTESLAVCASPTAATTSPATRVKCSSGLRSRRRASVLATEAMAPPSASEPAKRYSGCSTAVSRSRRTS